MEICFKENNVADVTTQEAPANTPSVIENAQKLIDKIKRAHQNVHFCTTKISIEEKLLAGAIKMRDEYNSSITTLSESLREKRRCLEASSKFLMEHDPDHEVVNKIDAIVAQIMKKKKKLEELL